jgi:hypothetical protein
MTLGPASPDKKADFAGAGRTLTLIRTYNALNNYVDGEQIYLYRVEPSD